MAFAYIAGTAKDKNGNPLDDSAIRVGDQTVGSIGSVPVGIAGAPNINNLIIINVPVYYDWQQGVPTITVEEVCYSKGNCSVLHED